MFIPKPFRAFAFITFLDPEVRRQFLSKNNIFNLIDHIEILNRNKVLACMLIIDSYDTFCIQI